MDSSSLILASLILAGGLAIGIPLVLRRPASADEALASDLAVWNLRLISSRAPTREEMANIPAAFYSAQHDRNRLQDQMAATEDQATLPPSIYRIATLTAPDGQRHTMWARIHHPPGSQPIAEWNPHPQSIGRG